MHLKSICMNAGQMQEGPPPNWAPQLAPLGLGLAVQAHVPGWELTQSFSGIY